MVERPNKGRESGRALIMVLSADGKTNTVTVTGVNANGQPIYNVAVYDKQ
jgi:hypothetical protein